MGTFRVRLLGEPFNRDSFVTTLNSRIPGLVSVLGTHNGPDFGCNVGLSFFGKVAPACTKPSLLHDLGPMCAFSSWYSPLEVPWSRFGSVERNTTSATRGRLVQASRGPSAPAGRIRARLLGVSFDRDSFVTSSYFACPSRSDSLGPRVGARFHRFHRKVALPARPPLREHQRMNVADRESGG